MSPSLKAYGIPGRARLFEVVQKVREVNARRQQSGARTVRFTGASSDAKALQASPTLAVDYVAGAAADGSLYRNQQPDLSKSI